MLKLYNFITQTIQVVFLFLIRLYQKTLSPDHGYGRLLNPRAGCIFYPSCSDYTYQAIVKYGTGRGLIKGLSRLIRCHPGGAGGVDLV